MSEYTGANAYAMLMTYAMNIKSISDVNFGKNISVDINTSPEDNCSDFSISLYRWENGSCNCFKTIIMYTDKHIIVTAYNGNPKSYDSFQDFLEGEGI